MKRQYDPDLFKDTTMTFGEHLEELRRCLILALLGLALGVLIGLGVGKWVVALIQVPLLTALTDFYREQDIQQHRAALAEAIGTAGAARQQDAYRHLTEQEGMVPEDLYFEPRSMLEFMQRAFSPALDGVTMPPDPPGRTYGRYGPVEIVREDVVDPGALCRKLQAAGRAPNPSPAKRIFDLMPAADRALVATIAESNKCGDEQRQALATALNHVIARDELYDAAAFGDLTLVSEAKELDSRRQLLSNDQRARYHRLLLEAAFPSEILKTYPTLLHVTIWRKLEHDPRVRAQALSVAEPLSIYVKAAMLAGVIISSPWVFYWLWSFVAAGLYPHEKHYVYLFLPFSLILFLGGAALAFFFVFQPVLSFFLSFNAWLGIDTAPRITEWLNFVLLMPLGFGVSFQLPLVMLFLERIGIFDVQAYVEKWRVAVLVIFIIAMVLTPSMDPWSMLLMAVPLCILYFGGLLLCRYMPRGSSAWEEEGAAA